MAKFVVQATYATHSGKLGGRNKTVKCDTPEQAFAAMRDSLAAVYGPEGPRKLDMRATMIEESAQ